MAIDELIPWRLLRIGQSLSRSKAWAIHMQPADISLGTFASCYRIHWSATSTHKFESCKCETREWAWSSSLPPMVVHLTVAAKTNVNFQWFWVLLGQCNSYLEYKKPSLYILIPPKIADTGNLCNQPWKSTNLVSVHPSPVPSQGSNGSPDLTHHWVYLHL